MECIKRMSNQVFANETRRYFTQNFSEFALVATMPYNTAQFVVSSTMVQAMWGQIGSSITKNGITFGPGASTAIISNRNRLGATQDTDRGELTMLEDGDYMVSGEITLKRVVGVGDREHYMGLSVNGANPITFCSGYEISDNTLLTLSCSQIFTLVAGDTVSINYAQNLGADNIYAKYNLKAVKII